MPIYICDNGEAYSDHEIYFIKTDAPIEKVREATGNVDAVSRDLEFITNAIGTMTLEEYVRRAYGRYNSFFEWAGLHAGDEYPYYSQFIPCKTGLETPPWIIREVAALKDELELQYLNKWAECGRPLSTGKQKGWEISAREVRREAEALRKLADDIEQNQKIKDQQR